MYIHTLSDFSKIWARIAEMRGVELHADGERVRCSFAMSPAKSSILDDITHLLGGQAPQKAQPKVHPKRLTFVCLFLHHHAQSSWPGRTLPVSPKHCQARQEARIQFLERVLENREPAVKTLDVGVADPCQDTLLLQLSPESCR